MEYYPVVILAVGVAVVIGMIMLLRVNAFFALITAAILVSLMSPGVASSKLARVAEAFGQSAGGIGIVIALAAVIGKCLMDSGAADRIVRSFTKALGEERAPFALMGSGFVLSIPVFFDTVFYLLVPLARSMWRSKRKNYVLYTTAIVAGGAVTHSMVPPTPGPLAIADNLHVDLGVMIVAGVMVGIPMSLVGLAACWILNHRFPIEMRPYATEIEARDFTDEELPPLSVSLLPVVLPVILIATNTITSAVADKTSAGWQMLLAVTQNLGNPNLALLFSAAIAIGIVIKYRRSTLEEMSTTVEQALMSGGVVILITAAGGAFGKMLAAAGIDNTIKSALGEAGSVAGITVLLTAFAVASLVKFAQGSGTVAMITTSSMFGAMAFTQETLGFHIVYLATAIGSGSLVGDWMNNSGFWVFSKMSVLTTNETLKTWSILTAVLGITGLVVTLLAATVLPMV
ncbi:MAG: TRAP transporter large permease subunit [Planctomycetales bacterium]|nr:TRAP transporter large permease subunit [Planctomycetales bacterium]